MSNIPVMKFIIYTNRTMTALSYDSEIITCINGVWPTTNTIGKNDKSYFSIIQLPKNTPVVEQL